MQWTTTGHMYFWNSIEALARVLTKPFAKENSGLDEVSAAAPGYAIILTAIRCRAYILEYLGTYLYIIYQTSTQYIWCGISRILAMPTGVYCVHGQEA